VSHDTGEVDEDQADLARLRHGIEERILDATLASAGMAAINRGVRALALHQVRQGAPRVEDAHQRAQGRDLTSENANQSPPML
jgi:hypothetical protein